MISFCDVFRWLNRFEGSKLTSLDRILLDLVKQKITEGKFSDADRVIEYLKSYQKTREDAFEKGEIWVECGLAYYDIGDPFKVVKSLKMAKKEFTASSHKRAVACWMLGTIQWDIENDNAEALINWKWAIEDFDLLEKIAEQDRRVKERNWYVERILEMEDNLQEKILEKFS